MSAMMRTVMSFPKLALPRLAGPSRLPMRPLHQQQFRSLLPFSSHSLASHRPQPLLAPSLVLHHSRSFPLTSRPTSIVTRPASTTTRPSPSTIPNSHAPPPNPEPEPEPEPTSAYARFKRLSKKYGWYAVGVYLALTAVDLSLTFAVVHAFGAERIEPLFKGVMHQYRVLRYGEPEAIRIEEESRKEAEVKEAEEKAELEKLSPEERKKKQASLWGSRTFWAELVLAYTIHKTLLLPVRAGLTVAWTPPLVKWLTRRGWVGKVSTNMIAQ